MIVTRKNTRRLGQGMTEYIVLVGLIGILLIAAVGRFKEQIRVTIEGSDGQSGMVGEVDGVREGIAANNVDAPPATTNRPPAEWGQPDANGVYTHPNGTTGRWNGREMVPVRPGQ